MKKNRVVAMGRRRRRKNPAAGRGVEGFTSGFAAGFLAGLMAPFLAGVLPSLEGFKPARRRRRRMTEDADIDAAFRSAGLSGPYTFVGGKWVKGERPKGNATVVPFERPSDGPDDAA